MLAGRLFSGNGFLDSFAAGKGGIRVFLKYGENC